MNVVIYDTEHFETVYALIRILGVDSHSITVFTNRDTADEVTSQLGKDAVRIRWVIFPSKSYFNVFRIWQHCNKYQVSHIFLNTVSYHHFFFGLLCKLCPKTVFLLTIHTANNFFDPEFSLTPRGFLRYLGKRTLVSAVSSYIVLLSSIKEHIEKTFQPDKPIYCLPGGLFEEQDDFPVKTDHRIRLVVPGSVDPYRRDYEQIFELAAYLDEYTHRYEIIFLGKPVGAYGQRIHTLCRMDKFRNVKFSFYTDFVPHAEYEKQLRACDYVFLPLVGSIRKPGEKKEVYGQSICSGGFFDAVRFAKPLLIPDYVPVADELKDQCVTFHNIRQLSLLLSQLTPSQFSLIKQKALANAKKFSVTSIRQAFAGLPSG